jgi:hypothetical protein
MSARRMRLAKDLLAELRQHGCLLWLDENDGRVKYPPWGRGPAEFQKRVRALRPEIRAVLIARLTASPSRTSPTPKETTRVPDKEPRPSPDAPIGADAPPSASRSAGHPGGHDADQHDRVGNAARREEKRQLLRWIMDGQKCTDCGKEYRWFVMTLDPGPGRTVETLNRLANRKASLDRIVAVIREWEPVCLNCYATRQHRRRGSGDEPSPNVRWVLWDRGDRNRAVKQ